MPGKNSRAFCMVKPKAKSQKAKLQNCKKAKQQNRHNKQNKSFLSNFSHFHIVSLNSLSLLSFLSFLSLLHFLSFSALSPFRLLLLPLPIKHPIIFIRHSITIELVFYIIHRILLDFSPLVRMIVIRWQDLVLKDFV